MRLAIDVSSLSIDHRGMGFFLRGFLDQLILTNHDLTIRLVTNRPVKSFVWPFPVVNPHELNPSWFTWFPFNLPSFRAPGGYAVTIHDLAPFVFPKGESRLRKKMWDGAHEAAMIFADSHFIAGQIEEILRIEPSKINVIAPGFSSAWPPENAFLPTPPYLLAVGPAEPRKNFERLLQAFKRVRKSGFPHKLALVGELPPWRRTAGPFVFERRNPLVSLAVKLGLEDDVIFPGRVSRAELRNWYDRASLLIVPSLYEGFGFPVLEAYSRGIPVLCSQRASLPEVAGDAAVYFNPHDVEEMASAIEGILTNPAGIAERKELAKRQLARFTWESCVKAYLLALSCKL